VESLECSADLGHVGVKCHEKARDLSFGEHGRLLGVSAVEIFLCEDSEE